MRLLKLKFQVSETMAKEAFEDLLKIEDLKDSMRKIRDSEQLEKNFTDFLAAWLATAYSAGYSGGFADATRREPKESLEITNEF